MDKNAAAANPEAEAEITRLRAQIRELEAMNRNKALWLATLAHDFKGALANMIWMAQSAASGNLSKDAFFELLPEIEQTARKNLQTLETTLSAAKLHMEQGKTVQKTIQFKDIFQALQAYSESFCTRKSIRLRLEGDPETTLVCDPLLLYSVLFKVVDNALKFSFAGGEVRFSARGSKQGKVQFLIEDSGMGMNRQTLESVFTLERAPYLGTWEEAGAGFGLVMAKEILYILEGTIQISSEEGAGTRVLIELQMQL